MNRFVLFEPLYRHSARGRGWSESVVLWAVDLLGRGVDTPSLRILAGLPSSSPSADVDEYFVPTLVELGQAGISRAEPCLGEARALADAIGHGEIPPPEGAAAVHSRAVSPLNHPPILQRWCDLDSGFRTLEDGKTIERLEGDALDDAIVALAGTFLAADPAEQLEQIQDDPGGDS